MILDLKSVLEFVGRGRADPGPNTGPEPEPKPESIFEKTLNSNSSGAGFL